MYVLLRIRCEWREEIGRLAVMYSIAVTCAGWGYVRIPESTFMRTFRTVIGEEEEERSGEKGEEREGRLSREYSRHGRW